MSIDELTRLLARIQVLDNRQVDELTIQAWQPLMVDVKYSDAVEAVNQHARESTEYLKPAHIIRIVRERQRALEPPRSMSPEVPADCGHHRWVGDGTTCLYCATRRLELTA